MQYSNTTINRISVYLYYLICLPFIQQNKEESAAVKIQSGYRGYQARRRVKTIRDERANSLEVFVV